MRESGAEFGTPLVELANAEEGEVDIDFDGPLAFLRALDEGYRVDERVVLVACRDAPVIPVAALVRRGDDW